MAAGGERWLNGWLRHSGTQHRHYLRQRDVALARNAAAENGLAVVDCLGGGGSAPAPYGSQNRTREQMPPRFGVVTHLLDAGGDAVGRQRLSAPAKATTPRGRSRNLGFGQRADKRCIVQPELNPFRMAPGKIGQYPDAAVGRGVVDDDDFRGSRPVCRSSESMPAPACRAVVGPHGMARGPFVSIVRSCGVGFLDLGEWSGGD